MAATRNTAAARLADGWVRLRSRRPPETRFWGARVSQAVKWCSVRQRVGVGADLGDQLEGGIGGEAIDLREVDAGEVVEDGPHVEG